MSWTDLSFSSWKASMNARKVTQDMATTTPYTVVSSTSCNTAAFCNDGIHTPPTCDPPFIDSCGHITISQTLSNVTCSDDCAGIEKCNGDFGLWCSDGRRCSGTQSNTCADFDTTKLCTMGTYGKGTCRSPCKIGKILPLGTQINNGDSGDIGIYTRTLDEGTWGWVFCTYEYDYDNFDTTKFYDLYSWINDIYNNLKENTPANFWAGPIGTTADNWQAYSFCHGDGSQTFATLQGAQQYAETTLCDGGSPSFGIMVNDDASAYQLRIGSAVNQPDGANFGNAVYNRKRNDPVLTPIYINMFRDSNVIYAPINLIYNAIYNTGIYSTIKVANPFRNNCQFLKGEFSFWSNSIISNWIATIMGLYSSPPEIIQKSLQKIILLPVPVQNIDSYSLILNLSYEQYNKYSTNSDKNGLLSSYIANFLQDSNGSLIINNQTTSVSNPIVSVNSANDRFTIINLSDFSIQTNVLTGEFPMSDPKYFFASAQITVDIQRWSPMMLLYFCNIGINIQFSNAVCYKIQQDSGLYPLVGYQNACSVVKDPDFCKSLVQQNCIVSYTPPISAGDSTVADGFILSGNSAQCKCYNSYLPPVSVNNLGNPGAMCFDIHCDPITKTFFGLNDSTCKQYCNQVWNWMNSTGKDQSRNPGDLDTDTFAQVCGVNYKPFENPKYNKKVLVSTICITILFSASVFLFSMDRKFSKNQVIIATLISLIILSILSVFLSYDLSGQGSCKNFSGNFVCRSKITNMEIPDQFCSFRQDCECESDQNCPGNCICASTTCIPTTGERKFKIVQKSNIDITQAVTVPICIILAGVIFVYAIRVYQLKFSNKVLYTILTVLGLTVIISLVLILTKKSKVQEFEGACCSPKCDGIKCGTDDKCGGTCPCYDGTQCCAGNCISNNSTCCNNIECEEKSSCINGTCISYPDSCPMKGSVTGKINIQGALSSGNYLIQYGEYCLNPFDTSTDVGYNTLFMFSAQTIKAPWKYLDDYTLSGKDIIADEIIVYMGAYDLESDESAGITTYTCGNTSVPTYAGGVSAQARNFSKANRFIITSNTIYSIDANAFIIPDLSSYENNIPPGYYKTQANSRGTFTITGGTVITLTYTLDPAQAAVWTITPYS